MFRIYGSVLAAICFIGWLIYQAAVKKKKLTELKGDIMAVVFFIGVWMLIYFLLLN